jgi:hypothetical protein
MSLESIYAAHYSDKRTEQMHVAALLADLLAWGRARNQWIRTIVEDAASTINFPLAE